MSNDNMDRIGEFIRVRRNAMGLTQEELSEKADLSGNYVSQVERGANISLRNLSKIYKTFGMDIEDLLANPHDPDNLREFYSNISKLSKKQFQVVDQLVKTLLEKGPDF